jgi:hypothetical protein
MIRQKLGQSDVGAMLGDEPFQIVAPTSGERLAEDFDRRLAHVGKCDCVARHETNHASRPPGLQRAEAVVINSLDTPERQGDERRCWLGKGDLPSEDSSMLCARQRPRVG